MLGQVDGHEAVLMLLQHNTRDLSPLQSATADRNLLPCLLWSCLSFNWLSNRCPCDDEDKPDWQDKI